MSAPTLVHKYRPRGKFVEFFENRSKEVLLGGAAGTGKSRAAMEKLNLQALKYARMRGLIVRQTRESLGSSALVTWREHVVPEALENGTVWFYGGSAEEPPQYRYSNGSVIVVGGMDKPSKIMSTEYDVAYVQEAVELNVAGWEAITTRLRNGRMPYQQLIADCNPDAPTHWLKQRADAGKTVLLETRHEDNPRYFDDEGNLTDAGRDYIPALDNLTGVRYYRLRKGLWVGAEGIIYDEFDPQVHVIDRFEIPSDWTRYWSIDFGVTNPFVCQFWAEDPDGRAYLYREFYGAGRLHEDWADDILKSVTDSDGKWTEPKPHAIIADHDADGRGTFERKIGMRTIAAKKDVLEGIDAVASRLRRAIDGRPRLFILKNAVVHRDQNLIDAGKPACTEEEVPRYVWANKGTKEQPQKENDHGCDAKRYYVAYRDLQPKFNIR